MKVFLLVISFLFTSLSYGQLKIPISKNIKVFLENDYKEDICKIKNKNVDDIINELSLYDKCEEEFSSFKRNDANHNNNLKMAVKEVLNSCEPTSPTPPSKPTTPPSKPTTPPSKPTTPPSKPTPPSNTTLDTSVLDNMKDEIIKLYEDAFKIKNNKERSIEYVIIDLGLENECNAKKENDKEKVKEKVTEIIDNYIQFKSLKLNLISQIDISKSLEENIANENIEKIISELGLNILFNATSEEGKNNVRNLVINEINSLYNIIKSLNTYVLNNDFKHIRNETYIEFSEDEKEIIIENAKNLFSEVQNDENTLDDLSKILGVDKCKAPNNVEENIYKNKDNRFYLSNEYSRCKLAQSVISCYTNGDIAQCVYEKIDEEFDGRLIGFWFGWARSDVDYLDDTRTQVISERTLNIIDIFLGKVNHNDNNEIAREILKTID